MKQSKNAEKKRPKLQNWFLRYVLVAVILGVIEGITTFYFLDTVCCETLVSGLFNNPLDLAPYIFVMGLVSVIALYLLIEHDAVNAMLFISFIAIWLVIGFGFYYNITATACTCPAATISAY